MKRGREKYRGSENPDSRLICVLEADNINNRKSVLCVKDRWMMKPHYFAHSYSP